MSVCALRHLRPHPAPLRVLAAAVLMGLAACAGVEQHGSTAGQAAGAAAGISGPGASGGPLFARALDQIAELYIEPVSVRRVAVAGAARLGRLDKRLAVSDSLGGGALALSYDDRQLAFYAIPGSNDGRAWAAALDTVIAGAQQASPVLAALPRDRIEQAVLDGMTASLDRFSRYAGPDQAVEQRTARQGYVGIGITLEGTSDIFRVTAVTPHSPADRAGIRPEDQIVAIDGVTTAGCVHRDVIERLRGPIGTPVAVQVIPAGASQPRHLRLQRASVLEPVVTAWRDGNIAVLRVNGFNHSTSQRMAEALAEVQRHGPPAGIVLDLRGNPGGVLEQATSLADLFLRSGPIVSVTGRHPASRQYFAASGRAIAPQVPMAVLINGGSASGAEIVAAALQDAGRAVVIGSSSFGKGTVQTVLRLPNNGELILTWARLVAPSGYVLQQHGVVPTVCTADLPDDTGSLAVGLQRAVSGAAGSRAALDENAWSELRRACPGRRTRPAVDLELAKRLLADPRLYAEALRSLPGTPRVTQTAAASGRALP